MIYVYSVCVCIHVYACVCIHVCACVCIHVCACVCIRVYAWGEKDETIFQPPQSREPLAPFAPCSFLMATISPLQLRWQINLRLLHHASHGNSDGRTVCSFPFSHFGSRSAIFQSTSKRQKRVQVRWLAHRRWSFSSP